PAAVAGGLDQGACCHAGPHYRRVDKNHSHSRKPTDSSFSSRVARHASLEMILPVVRYGHPALRQKGARIESVTLGIKQLIADMFETMYANKGVGLAAQQVGQALQLTVIDVRGATDR